MERSRGPGRKLGHCTILKSRAAERNRALADVLVWSVGPELLL